MPDTIDPIYKLQKALAKSLGEVGLWDGKVGVRFRKAHIALIAIVEERDALREQLRLANIDQCNTEAEANDRDRDLRERLVCAALTGLLASVAAGSETVAEWAVDHADATLAAMRKGEA